MYNCAGTLFPTKRYMTHLLFFLVVFLLCAGRGFLSPIDALPVPEAANILANTDISTVQVVQPAKQLVSESDSDKNSAVVVTTAAPTAATASTPVTSTQSTTEVETVPKKYDVTSATNLLKNGATANSNSGIPMIPGSEVDRATVMKSIIPTPLQPIVDPDLAPDATTANMTRAQTRNHAIATKGVPFAIATAAGLAASIGTEAVLVAGSGGLAAVPGLAAAGVVGAAVHNITYTATSRAARKFLAKHGGTRTGAILAATDNNGFNRTAEVERVDAEIAAEKNRTLGEKVKGMAPLLVSGALGLISNSVVAGAAHRAVSMPVGVGTTGLSTVAINKMTNNNNNNNTSSNEGNNTDITINNNNNNNNNDATTKTTTTTSATQSIPVAAAEENKTTTLLLPQTITYLIFPF
ncbi:hypothetical protein BDF22DRAFT_666700 [Syncephalis plumigaleata]|nr:hypothetical protein BDF22DRAFT_666700 [Syncephalis plumigaleata]